MTLKVQHLDKLYIDGEWVAPIDGAPITVVSPDTDEVVCEVAGAGPRDMDRAVAAARKAFDEGPWPTMTPAERAGILSRLADLLAAREGELAEAWSLQTGALRAIGPFMTGVGTQHFRDAVKLGETFAFERSVATPVAASGLLIYEPVGVVAAITPWNAPYMLMASKVASSLLAGCTVVMKPSPETPLEAHIIAECAEQAGVPAGVLNLVPADREAADCLIHNQAVDKISFTGSTAVGKRIARVCAERIGRYTLELGGKSAVIVLDDMEDEEVAKILTSTITMMSGQVCAMLSRAIVPRHRYDRIAAAIVREMVQVRIGRSDDPEAQMGPLATRRQLERVEGHVAAGREQGATVLTGGKRPAHLAKGAFYEPTLFTGVTNDMTIAREEIFGPVLCLIASDSVEEAIRIANDSDYGLNSSVLTHDTAAAAAIARKLRAGSFAQNGLRTDFSLPMGGCKQSGIGREGGEFGLMNYLEVKTVLLDAPVG